MNGKSRLNIVLVDNAYIERVKDDEMHIDLKYDL